MNRTALTSFTVLCLISAVVLLGLGSNVQPVKASEAIRILTDGSISPPTAPIMSDDNITYTLTADVASTYVGIRVERSNITIDGSGHIILQDPRHLYGSHGIQISFENNVTIKNVEIRAFYDGVYVYESANNCIHSNTLIDNLSGICLERASMNSILENNITDNDNGICLYSGSTNNTIYRNNITRNSRGFDAGSSNNTIMENNIENNDIGFNVGEGGEDNLVYRNNFVDNTEHVHNYYYLWYEGERHGPYYWHCVWDYEGEGNYWSDYEETYPDAEELDGSGIWDTPYVIDENNQDNYPLIPEFPSALILPLLLALTLGVAVLLKKKRLYTTDS